MATSDLDASDLEAQWAAKHVSGSENLLRAINELGARWQRAREEAGFQRNEARSFTQGRMEGYVQAIALLLLVPHAEIKGMLLRRELPYDESHRRRD